MILRRKAVTVHKDLSTCSFAFLVYKAQFPKTIAEEKTEEPYVKKMIGMLSVLMAVSVGLFAFLKKYVGPERPRTLTEEWRADAKKIARQRRANPITGVSSNQS